MQYLNSVQKLAAERTKELAIIGAVTIIMWVLLFFGFLPKYCSSPLEEKLSYLFPVWVVAGIFVYAYLYDRIDDDEGEKAKTD